jgi:hypothetical protein
LRSRRYPYRLADRPIRSDIEHRTRRARSSPTNGFVERMNRMLLESLRVQGRSTWHIGVEEIQRDLDRFPWIPCRTFDVISSQAVAIRSCIVGLRR